MIRQYILAMCASLLCCLTVCAQEVVQLYSSTETADLKLVTLTVYQAKQTAKGKTAVLVIPGGAYGFLATETEGTPIAKALAERGITALVLRYRLPAEVFGDRTLAPLQDAQQALLWIRKHAGEYTINPAKVGVMGFSAGGHLASMLGTKFGKEQAKRPDFMALVYPVISMQDSLTHVGSRYNLIGKDATHEQVDLYSAELQVSKQTPPAYLTHAMDDGLVSYRNSVVFDQALQAAGVRSKLVLVPTGDHGFIQRIALTAWLDPLILWVKEIGF